MSAPAAFLDRDGTINAKPAAGEYVTSADDFLFLPGAERAVQLLDGAGWRVIVVSNQRGVALGRMTLEDVHAVNARMAHLPIAGVYVCPHECDSCTCRKPGTGLFDQARADFPDIRFDQAVVIGDAESDMAAGRAIGARTYRVGAPPLPSLLEVAEQLAGGEG
jgi:D-glycero-D-manno-heptose 1,7-bisphosphate phosphatase